jgi:hypothetical protein
MQQSFITTHTHTHTPTVSMSFCYISNFHLKKCSIKLLHLLQEPSITQTYLKEAKTESSPPSTLNQHAVTLAWLTIAEKYQCCSVVKPT